MVDDSSRYNGFSSKIALNWDFGTNRISGSSVGAPSTKLLLLHSSSDNFDTAAESLTPSSSSARAAKTPADASSAHNSIVTIRPALYKELGDVANLMVDCFYKPEQRKGMFKRLYVLAELNRLQNNFPHFDTDVHQMFVATTISCNNEKDGDDDATSVVVGFCDVDCRPCPDNLKQKLPRPYLSDVLVDPQYRRQGIAKALVMKSEHFVVQDGLNGDVDQQLLDLLQDQEQEGQKGDAGDDDDDIDNGSSIANSAINDIVRRDRLYIRVEADNTAALKLYHGRSDASHTSGSDSGDAADVKNGGGGLGLGYDLIKTEELVEGPAWNTLDENRLQHGSKVVHTLCKRLTVG
jgi:ribosomal protein S18 acetylase RimI-like enzyme